MDKHRNFCIYLEESLTRCIRDAIINLHDQWQDVPLDKIPPAEATKRAAIVTRIKDECRGKVNSALGKMKLAGIQDIVRYTVESAKTADDVEPMMLALLAGCGMDPKIGLYPDTRALERIKRYLLFFYEAVIATHH